MLDDSRFSRCDARDCYATRTETDRREARLIATSRDIDRLPGCTPSNLRAMRMIELYCSCTVPWRGCLATLRINKPRTTRDH